MDLIQLSEEKAVYQYKTPKLVDLIQQCMEELESSQHKLVIGIVDEKDWLIEQAAYESYKAGFCDGMGLASGIFENNKIAKSKTK